jgi:hypothetical protein
MLRIYFLQQWFNRKRQRKHTVDELTPRPASLRHRGLERRAARSRLKHHGLT